MSGYVLDASMTLAWHFRDERRPDLDELGERAMREGVTVPGHWFAEVANGLLVAQRGKRTTVAESAEFIARLRMFPLEIEAADHELAFGRALPLARAYGLTVYDALYLELCERSGLPLATLDSALIKAARATGLTILDGTNR